MGEGKKREVKRTVTRVANGDLKKEPGSAKLKNNPEKKAPPVRKKSGEGVLKSSRRFLEGVWHELKKVHWPARREVIIYTAVVLVTVTLIGVILWVFDLILSQILTRIIT